jgi:hypothetical protein
MSLSARLGLRAASRGSGLRAPHRAAGAERPGNRSGGEAGHSATDVALRDDAATMRANWTIAAQDSSLMFSE